MNMETNRNRTGITTAGATGCILLISVIGDFISPYWLFLSIPLIMSAIGTESGRA